MKLKDIKLGVTPIKVGDPKYDYRKITTAVIFKYGGSKAMRHAGSLFDLLNTVACDKYKKWEITRIYPWHDDEIIPVFPQDYGNIKDDDGGVRTFLDVILSKGMGINIPREFIFGFYEMNLKTGAVRFCENDKFYSKLNKKNMKNSLI